MPDTYGYLRIEGGHICYTNSGGKQVLPYDGGYSTVVGTDKKGYMRLEDSDLLRIYYIDEYGVKRRTDASESGGGNAGVSNKGYMWLGNDGYLWFIGPNGDKRKIGTAGPIGPVQVFSYDFLNSTWADVQNTWTITSPDVYLAANGLTTSWQLSDTARVPIDLTQAYYVKGEVTFYTSTAMAPDGVVGGQITDQSLYTFEWGLNGANLRLRTPSSTYVTSSNLSSGTYKLEFILDLQPIVYDVDGFNHYVDDNYKVSAAVYSGGTKLSEYTSNENLDITTARNINELVVYMNSDRYIQTVSLDVGYIAAGNTITVNSCTTSGSTATLNITATTPIALLDEYKGDIVGWSESGNTYIVDYDFSSPSSSEQLTFVSTTDAAVRTTYTINF